MGWHSVFVDEVALHDDRGLAVAGGDIVGVDTLTLHIGKQTRSVSGAVEAGNGICIPPHVGKDHHHIAAGAPHVIGHGESFAVANQDIEADEAGTDDYIFSFRFHVARFNCLIA